MVRLAVGTITYNDKEGLRRLIESINKNVDFHFIIDGKFPQMPGDHDFSTDGTYEIVDQFILDDHFEIRYFRYSAPEHEMRQYYVNLCAKFKVDALLILDSDEYVDNDHTDWKTFRYQIAEERLKQKTWETKRNVYSVEGFWGTVWDVPRLWIDPHEMIYVKGSHKIYKNKYHNDFLTRDGRMYAIYPETTKKRFAFRFIQDASLRSEHRIKQRDKYQEWLNVYEGSLV